MMTGVLLQDGAIVSVGCILNMMTVCPCYPRSRRVWARVARAPLHPHTVPTQPRHYERWGHRDTRGEMGAGVTNNQYMVHRITGDMETWRHGDSQDHLGVQQTDHPRAVATPAWCSD